MDLRPRLLRAQVVKQVLASVSPLSLWLRMPLGSNASADSRSWQWWDRLRTLCGYHAALGLVLDVSDSSADAVLSEWQAMWSAEPVRALVVPAAQFHANKKGFPVLAAPLQQLVRAALAEGVQVRGPCQVCAG